MIIESALKDLMSMNGVQYVYKRDFYWRTWRRIKNGTKEELIHYKSQSISEINCTICHSGFWEIEDKTELCRFEISAMNNREELTVFRPEKSKIQYSLTILNLIRKCGNPIKTKMRIAYKYDSKWPVFCQGREFCEIDTVYIIHPDFVLFQIINSTNIIIYSKIMMAGNRNFVCLDNCQKRSPTENKKVEIKQDLTVTSTFNTSDIKKKYHRSAGVDGDNEGK
nr:uncharacterized protein LOC116778271 [Danaus plexippus plexippus]